MKIPSHSAFIGGLLALSPFLVLGGCASAPKAGEGTPSTFSTSTVLSHGIQAVKDPHAVVELKAMSDALTAAKTFSFDVKTLAPLRGPNGQWVHMLKTAQVTGERPDHLRVVTGGDAFPQQIVFDGKTFSVQAPSAKLFTQTPMPGNIDTMLAQASEKGGQVFAFSDVLLSDPFANWSKDLLGAVYVGESTSEGQPLHHLAFVSKGADWEVFVGAKDHLPKLVYVKYLGAEKAPTVLIEFSKWKINPRVTASLFQFNAAPGSKQASFKAPKGTSK